jgi:hypothetical protein
VKFTIADGATDFVVGGSFTITVNRESGTDEEWKALDPSATDGAQIAAGVAIYDVTADDTSKRKFTGLVRASEVRAEDLEWPDAIGIDQRATAVQQLRAVGIILR